MRPVVQLDGRTLTPWQVREVVRGAAAVKVSGEGLERAASAARTAAQISARREVYGRTTGVGANRDQQVSAADLPEHGLRLLRSHAGGGGPLVAAELSRAMLVVRANQIAAGGSGVDPGVLGPLTDGINAGLSVPVPRYGAIGTGDLTALAVTALCLRGERDWVAAVSQPRPERQGLAQPRPERQGPAQPRPERQGLAQPRPERQGPAQPRSERQGPAQPRPERPMPAQPRFALASADALAFLSSNAATIGEAALACAELAELTTSSMVVAALSHTAVGASAEPYAAAVHEARSYPGQRAVAATLRGLVGSRTSGARIQDPYGYRALPQVHGPALDALAAADRAVTAELNAAAENPLIDVAGAAVWHNGNFHTVSLGLALDALRAALFQTAALSAARLGTLVEPAFTGLPPFLATDPPPSSGIMILEYVAHSAIADIRRLAAPAALGSAVLSRGVEEHAGFSTQSARATTEVTGAYRIALACELVAAVRALRMRGIRPGMPPLATAFERAADALPASTEDRALDADLTRAQDLLPDLAGLAEPELADVPSPAAPSNSRHAGPALS